MNRLQSRNNPVTLTFRFKLPEVRDDYLIPILAPAILWVVSGEASSILSPHDKVIPNCPPAIPNQTLMLSRSSESAVLHGFNARSYNLRLPSSPEKS